MFRRSILTVVLLPLIAALSFGQAGALRDFVGLISIHYHPDVIALMTRSRENLEKRGYSDAARSIDNYLKGISGSGFVYIAPDGTSYILTNQHVVAQSDTLSIAFEKQDGARITYDRLKVLFVDEEKDLALLAFDAGASPFAEGLSFSTSPVEEGGDIFAAGFPGLANTAIWQFSRGTVSNAAVRLPKDLDTNETIGPFIQHTAQIDPGNSGGPLLVTSEGVPTGYAVVGINTLSATRRQAANFAIPIDQVNTFITAALSREQQNDRELIARRVDDFLKGIRADTTLYGHIASFLSNASTASNAEYAITELLERGTRSALTDIDRIFSNDPVEGMGTAVGWLIEDSMRTRAGAIRITLESIDPDDKGGFSVAFNVNGKTVKSEWIKEFGVFRLDTYGDLVTGDKARLAINARRRAMRTDYALAVSVSFASILDHGSGFNAALRLSGFGVDVFSGPEGYLQVGMTGGFSIPVRLNSFALMPFGEVGWGITLTDASKKAADDDPMAFPFNMGINVKGGMMFTTAAVPGLFGRVFYQHNIYFGVDEGGPVQNHGIIGVGVGYGF